MKQQPTLSANFKPMLIATMHVPAVYCSTQGFRCTWYAAVLLWCWPKGKIEFKLAKAETAASSPAALPVDQSLVASDCTVSPGCHCRWMCHHWVGLPSSTPALQQGCPECCTVLQCLTQGCPAPGIWPPSHARVCLCKRHDTQTQHHHLGGSVLPHYGGHAWEGCAGENRGCEP
jgi:hypothetical protein